MEKSIKEKWGLFWVATLTGSLAMLVLWWSSPLQGEQEYRHMIRMSVRVSWPLLSLVFIASSATKLWPGSLSRWLLRNRKYIGLAFSAVMLWQIYFILKLMSTGAQIFAPGLASLFITSDLIGYTLLVLMSLTSFNYFRTRVGPKTWKYLHTFGLFYIWFIYFYSFILGTVFSIELSEKITYAPRPSVFCFCG